MVTKKDLLVTQEVAGAVGAGKAVVLETVDFNNPNRPKTCLEVDFPILQINQLATIEGNASKPIYQMSKWWARRRSSIFRSMLIAAAVKAPENPTHTAKLIWDNYYANHQRNGAFKHLKVADIFMGGGTTLVEGSRLGMQLTGNDLNPVAWFVVKQELANVDLGQVEKLLADIETEI
jgi:adenine-specific DNA methylase